jgi:hypothetical protein
MSGSGWQPTESPTCVCGHPADHHDRVATRYCAATVSGRLDRGCVCQPAPVLVSPGPAH